MLHFVTPDSSAQSNTSLLHVICRATEAKWKWRCFKKFQIFSYIPEWNPRLPNHLYTTSLPHHHHRSLLPACIAACSPLMSYFIIHRLRHYTNHKIYSESKSESIKSNSEPHIEQNHEYYWPTYNQLLSIEGEELLQLPQPPARHQHSY